MNQFSTALAVLSAIITPAVLISACGSLILATSQRLNRLIDWTREIANQLENLSHSEEPNGLQSELQEERVSLLFEQLRLATQRSRLLQQALSCLYMTLSAFAATSVGLGILAASGQLRLDVSTWIPIGFGLIGTGLLFSASVILTVESRLALTSTNHEMDFVIRLSRSRVPTKFLQRRKA